MYAQSFPALNNDVVTQGHANYCEVNGHAAHSTDGVQDPFCPRCGARTFTPAPDAQAFSPSTITGNPIVEDTYYSRELGDLVNDIHGRVWVIAYTVASDGTRAGTVYMAHTVAADGQSISDQAWTLRAEQIVNN